MTRDKRTAEKVGLVIQVNPLVTQTFWYTSCQYLNRGNKTVNINVKKTVVYLQVITAKWHIENGKNNERWYCFRSTL